MGRLWHTWGDNECVTHGVTVAHMGWVQPLGTVIGVTPLSWETFSARETPGEVLGSDTEPCARSCSNGEKGCGVPKAQPTQPSFLLPAPAPYLQTPGKKPLLSPSPQTATGCPQAPGGHTERGRGPQFCHAVRAATLRVLPCVSACPALQSSSAAMCRCPELCAPQRANSPQSPNPKSSGEKSIKKKDREQIKVREGGGGGGQKVREVFVVPLQQGKLFALGRRL